MFSINCLLLFLKLKILYKPKITKAIQLPNTIGTSFTKNTSCPVRKRKNEPKTAKTSQTVCILCNICEVIDAKIG